MVKFKALRRDRLWPSDGRGRRAAPRWAAETPNSATPAQGGGRPQKKKNYSRMMVTGPLKMPQPSPKSST